MIHKKIAIALLSLAALSTPAVAHEYFAPNFILIHPWSVATPEDGTDASVYFAVSEVAEDDRLLRAYTPMADAVEFRTGRDKQEQVEDIAIKVGEERRDYLIGGPHIYLKGLKQPFQWGRSYPLVLYFEKAGMINVSIAVGTF